jgi:hypothetical protein
MGNTRWGRIQTREDRKHASELAARASGGLGNEKMNQGET